MKRTLRYVVLLLLVVVPVQAFSQQVTTDDALRQKAYKLLESLAEQVGSLQSGENRARLGSNIAVSLWPHNEAKARELFATVTKEIKAGLERDDSDPDRHLAQPNFLKLREDTALRIGRLDPEWALKFLQETYPLDVKSSDDDRNDLNLRLALVFVEKNPDFALKLGPRISQAWSFGEAVGPHVRTQQEVSRAGLRTPGGNCKSSFLPEHQTLDGE